MAMNRQASNPLEHSQQTANREVVYPAEFHFRIIVEAQLAVKSRLGSVVAGYSVTSPLTSSRQSSAGRYQAYSLSVLIKSREELNALDAAIKQVPGVRMVL